MIVSCTRVMSCHVNSLHAHVHFNRKELPGLSPVVNKNINKRTNTMSKLIFQQQTQMTRNQTFTESLSFTDLIRCIVIASMEYPPRRIAHCSHSVRHLRYHICRLKKNLVPFPHQVVVVSIFGHLFFARFFAPFF